ncbi:23S rRNA (uracil(1939)-C(5))-methyltransferase RlmD [Owenweeksia hongkongensis]|uniref:23S rRNA (uracil(1939)-C(5))-methyltransferase RlmD n=1 Tax=Owenweeksia hongkongensis TaxID=253245 RepID=UPI003A8F569A
MSQKRPFSRNQRVELKIDDMAFEGKGISRVETEDGKYIVFVPNTIPGQVVSAKIIKAKNSYAEAKLLKVITPSPLEVEMPYHPIPGAPYITLPVEKQHEYKKNTTIELFKRIGKIENAADLLDEFMSSPDNFHYRNKMEYSFSAVGYDRNTDEEFDGFTLGFKKRGQWLSVEQLKKDSGLFDPQIENALPAISDYFTSRGFSAWHGLQHTGFCRFLTVKRSFSEDGLLINLVTTSSELDKFDNDGFVAFMKDILGDRLLGLVHTLNDDIGDRPLTTDGKQNVIYGKGTITEEICGLKFRISLESFFQTNPASAERLYQKALNYVFETEPGSRPVVMDLFSGTGTITQLLAQRSTDKEIIGVELVPQAVADAKKTAKANGFDNLKFFAADVGKFLLEHPEYTDKIDTIVMDPPRAGIAPKTLRKVIRLNANRMVYVSCNPATQARDMVTLAEAGYKLKKYSLVDQFPHTAHIESVALFER